jgi:hypothetical protein
MSVGAGRACPQRAWQKKIRRAVGAPGVRPALEAGGPSQGEDLAAKSINLRKMVSPDGKMKRDLFHSASTPERA